MLIWERTLMSILHYFGAFLTYRSVPLRRIQSVSWCSKNSGIPSVYVTRGINNHSSSFFPSKSLDLSSCIFFACKLWPCSPRQAVDWGPQQVNCPNNPWIGFGLCCPLRTFCPAGHLGGGWAADYNYTAWGCASSPASHRRHATRGFPTQPWGRSGIDGGQLGWLWGWIGSQSIRRGKAVSYLWGCYRQEFSSTRCAEIVSHRLVLQLTASTGRLGD